MSGEIPAGGQWQEQLADPRTLIETHYRLRRDTLAAHMGDLLIEVAVADVEDAVQETYARALASGWATTVATDSGEKANERLYGIAHTVANGERRRREREQETTYLNADTDEALLVEPSAESVVVEADVIHRLLDRLSPRERQVYIRIRAYAMKAQDVAAELGISEDKARGYLKAAAEKVWAWVHQPDE